MSCKNKFSNEKSNPIIKTLKCKNQHFCFKNLQKDQLSPREVL